MVPGGAGQFAWVGHNGPRLASPSTVRMSASAADHAYIVQNSAIGHKGLLVALKWPMRSRFLLMHSLVVVMDWQVPPLSQITRKCWHPCLDDQHLGVKVQVEG